MLTTRLRQWFLKRFIVISEIIGYALSAAVGLGILYSVFVEVEILTKVKGELRPSCMEIKEGADALFIEYLAASGEHVAKGQPILRVSVDDASKRSILLRHQLEEAVASLESDSSGESQASLEDARRALAALPPAEEKVETLAAPCGGFFQPLAGVRENDVVPAGSALARVYDMSVLRLDSVQGDARIADGQEARAVIPGMQERLVGQVSVIMAPSNHVSISFQDAPQAAREIMFASLFGKSEEKLDAVEAEVVVGHQSLFKKMFGRRQ